MSLKKLVIILLVLVNILLFSNCSSKPQAAISVDGQWGRPSPKTAMAGAFYLTIHNNGNSSDKLVGVQSTACGTAELHESVMDANNVMGMQPVQGGFIEIPAGKSVELKAGGLHIMCIDKKQEFTTGAKLPVVLKFEKFGDLAIEIEIREQ